MAARKYLDNGSILELREIEYGYAARFQIRSDGPIGVGASCVAYDALELSANRPVILKEFNPKYSGNLEARRNRFIHACKVQRDMMLKNHKATNAVTPHYGIFSGEGTVWVSSVSYAAATYDKVSETGVHDVLQTAAYIAEAMAVFHESGYVLLDLKPANFLCLSEDSGARGTVLIDFDAIADLVDGKIAEDSPLLYSSKYAAPELLRGLRTVIGPRADIFSLGAIVFESVFGRMPDVLFDCTPFSEYDFDNRCHKEWLTGKALDALTGFFHKSLSADVGGRYADAREMLNALRQLVELTHPAVSKAPRVERRVVEPTSHFVGRESELLEMRRFFAENDDSVKIFVITGEAGVGKSELARKYANSHRSQYDAISMAVSEVVGREGAEHYSDAIIDSFHYVNLDEERDPHMKRAECLRSSSESTLLLIDNVDKPESFDAIWAMAKNDCAFGRAHVIITSRLTDYIEDIYGSRVMKLTCSKESALSVFEQIYDKKLDRIELETAGKMLKLVGYNTYASDMIAREIKKYHPAVTLMSFFNDMTRCGIAKAEVDEARVQVLKDGSLSQDSIMSHLKILFSDMLAHDFTDVDKQVFLLLMQRPAEFMDIDTACMLIGDYGKRVRAKNAALALADRNWIRTQLISRDGDGVRQISIHPLVAEVLREKTVPCDTAALRHMMQNLLRSDVRSALDLRFCFEWLEYSGFGSDDWFWEAVRQADSGGLSNRSERNLERMLELAISAKTSDMNQVNALLRSGEGCLTRVSFGKPFDHHLPWYNLVHINETLIHILSSAGLDYYIEFDEHRYRVLFGYAKHRGVLNYFVFYPQEQICITFLRISAEPFYYSPASSGEHEADCRLIPTVLDATADITITRYIERPVSVVFQENSHIVDLCATASVPAELRNGNPVNRVLRAYRDGVSGATTEQARAYFTGFPCGRVAVEDCCFGGSKHLSEIRLPVLISIGESAFYGCSSLTSITIPEGVTSIGERAFCDCKSLTSITIPEGVTSIGDLAFYGCSSLTSVTIPESLKLLSLSAFLGCSSLANLSIPDGVTIHDGGIRVENRTIGSGGIPVCLPIVEHTGEKTQ